MQIIFTASPVTEVFSNACVQVAVMDTVLARTVDVPNRAALDAHFKDFMRELRAMDRAACVSMLRQTRDTSRAFAGWSKVRKSGYYVNLEKAPGGAEAKAKALAERRG